ncbi:MAG: hypothetical protein JJE36_06545 [Coriobacteriia bacterium]|nr:hypothetical protein [Coriobacteriia bacterium]
MNSKQIYIFSMCAIVLVGFAASAVSFAAETPNIAPTPIATLPDNALAAASSAHLVLSDASFDLSTQSPSIPETGSFNWTVVAKPTKKITSMQIHFNVLRDNGTLVFRRTRYINIVASAKKKQYTEEFQRTLEGLSMTEGVYRIAVEVTASTATSRETASLYGTQYIYNENNEPLDLACAVHFTSTPLRNPDGTFAVDPSTGTPEAQRQAVGRLLLLGSNNSNTRFTLSLSPLLLEDWEAIGNGYTLKNTNGTKAVFAQNSQTAENYAATLTSLRMALDSGTVTIGMLGYSDPDVSSLTDIGLIRDIPLQYGQATSTLSPLSKNVSSFETSVTAPLGQKINSTTLDELKNAKQIATVVDENAVTNKPDTIGRFSNNLIGLVADGDMSTKIVSKETIDVVGAIFEKYSTENRKILIIHGVVSNETQAAQVVDNIGLLLEQPWIKFATLGDITPKSTDKLPKLKLIEKKKIEPTSTDRAIKAARKQSEGLIFALSESVESLNARQDSLIAENGSSLVESGQTLKQSLRLAYAEKAQKTANDIFSKITLKVSPVTLSGNKGSVPITINNDTTKEVRVTLTYGAERNMTINAKKKQVITLPPKETFVEPDVTIQNAVSAPLTIKLTAGNYAICEKSVDISASYIDTIVIVVIVVLAGLGLVAFIYKRVKKADPEKDLFNEI